MSAGGRVSTPSRAERREARSQHLLEAALRVIRRVGADCSLDDVAAEVGVTRPVIYRYFGSREGLARAVSDHSVRLLRDTLIASMARARSERAALRRAIETYLAFIEAEPHLYRYVVRRSWGKGGSDDAGASSAFVEALARELAVVIRERLSAAGRDTAPAEAWGFALVGMVGAAGDWWLDRRPMPRGRLAEHLTQMAWEGMAGPNVDHATAGSDARPARRRTPTRG